jgi:hypothetical protein
MLDRLWFFRFQWPVLHAGYSAGECGSPFTATLFVFIVWWWAEGNPSRFTKEPGNGFRFCPGHVWQWSWVGVKCQARFSPWKAEETPQVEVPHCSSFCSQDLHCTWPSLTFFCGSNYNEQHSNKETILNSNLKVKVKIKLSLCFLTEHHAMKAYWEVEV